MQRFFRPLIRFSILLLIFPLVTTSCTNRSDTSATDSTDQAKKENDVKFDNKKQEKDAAFLVQAAGFYLEQQRLSELAQRKGETAVKGLASHLEEAHAKSLKAVKELAKSKQVSLPDTASADVFTYYQQLEGKAGHQFDQAFCERLVNSHKDVVEAFEKEAADSRDQDIKDWAKTELQELRKHLDLIFDCQKKVGKP